MEGRAVEDLATEEAHSRVVSEKLRFVNWALHVNNSAAAWFISSNSFCCFKAILVFLEGLRAPFFLFPEHWRSCFSEFAMISSSESPLNSGGTSMTSR